MVTRNYLASQDAPQAVVEYTYEGLRDRLTAAMRAALPDWSGAVDSDLYKAIEVFARDEFYVLQRLNAQVRQVYAYYARGAGLRALGANRLLVPAEGESDDAFLQRYIDSALAESVGTFESVERLARLGPVSLLDTHAVSAANNQDVVLYALKSPDKALLNAAERTALQVYMNGRDKVLAGRSVAVNAVRTQAYAITATIEYMATDTDVAALEDAVRGSLVEYIAAHHALNRGIYTSQVISAIGKVEGVLKVTLAAPSADLVRVDDLVYIGPSRTAITLTFTDVS